MSESGMAMIQVLQTYWNLAFARFKRLQNAIMTQAIVNMSLGNMKLGNMNLGKTGMVQSIRQGHARVEDKLKSRFREIQASAVQSRHKPS